MEAIILNPNGITSSTPSIHRNVCEKNGWYLDLLKDNSWMVSYKDSKIFICKDIKQSVYFFMAKSEPVEPMTKEEEDKLFEWLETQLSWR